MNQYIVLIQANQTSVPAPEEWGDFFAMARQSGLFKGGSAIGDRILIGDADSAKSTEHIVGYMRFDAVEKQQVLDLLAQHPVVIHGGSIELCEMPET